MEDIPKFGSDTLMHPDSNEIIDVQLVWVRQGKILRVKAKNFHIFLYEKTAEQASFVICILEQKMLICNTADIKLIVDCGDL